MISRGGHDIALVSVFGTLGDVRPLIALASGLKRAGHRIRLFARAEYRALAVDHGIDLETEWCQLQCRNMADYFNSEAGQRWIRNRATWADRREALADFRSQWRQVRAQLEHECHAARAIVSDCSSPIMGAWALAAQQNIPYVISCPMPMFAPTGAFNIATRFPRLPLPFMNRWAGQVRVWGTAFAQVLDPDFRAFGRRLGLRVRSPRFIARFFADRVEQLITCSPHLLTRPHDWGSRVRITGYCTLPTTQSWIPPEGLAAFLAAGPPPICFGFGSYPFFGGADGRGLIAAISGTLAAAGKRGILSTGDCRTDQTGELPPHLYAIDSAPHEWLLPRCAAIVHHGGYGTTHTALLAGKPMIVYPFQTDQFLWARRMAELGVSPSYRTTADRLSAEALAADLPFVDRPESLAAAGRLKTALEREDGLTAQVAAIGAILARS